MFFFFEQNFDKELLLTKPVPEHWVVPERAWFYDKDGFELTPLEQVYYTANGVELTNYLYNNACHKPWVEQDNESSGIVLDHSMTLQRYAFTEEAREQLLQKVKRYPILRKLLQTRPKWGLDFSVDYIDDEEVVDVFHFEFDSYSYDRIVEMHEWATKKIKEIDWVSGAQSIKARKDEWRDLDGHSQSNWKARFFGFETSEEICKAF
jgi:hypothetical protein